MITHGRGFRGPYEVRVVWTVVVTRKPSCILVRNTRDARSTEIHGSVAGASGKSGPAIFHLPKGKNEGKQQYTLSYLLAHYT